MHAHTAPYDTQSSVLTCSGEACPSRTSSRFSRPGRSRRSRFSRPCESRLRRHSERPGSASTDATNVSKKTPVLASVSIGRCTVSQFCVMSAMNKPLSNTHQPS